MKYGTPPEILGEFHIGLEEFCFYMYQPIKLRYSDRYLLEKRLEPLKPLIEEVMYREGDLTGKYIYLTVKNMFQPKGLSHNRPGWHSDGFGTDDVNYIFSDNTPTEFCIQDFNVPDDDRLSLAAFESQAKVDNIVTYPDGSLLRLTPASIHRIGVKMSDGPRLFVKISISDRQYKLRGNSTNSNLSYDFGDFIDRELTRNTP